MELETDKTVVKGLGWVTRGSDVLLETLYPRRCAGCGCRGVWVCARCELSSPQFAPPWCDGCGIPLAVGHCACADIPTDVAAVRSVGRYAGWLREAIIAFKYQDEWARADHLGALIGEHVFTLGELDALSFVPLHRSRQRRRGYNQAELLASVAGAITGMSVLTVLQRTRETVPQVGLPASERARNVNGAFAPIVGVSVEGLRLGLVDDVLTTGSTVGACAAVLRQAGALPIAVVVLARDGV